MEVKYSFYGGNVWLSFVFAFTFCYFYDSDMKNVVLRVGNVFVSYLLLYASTFGNCTGSDKMEYVIAIVEL